jgi:SEL1 protein
MRGGHRGDDNVDEFRETILLVMLCLGVSVLLYIRTRLVERIRRDQQQDQQAQQQVPEQAPQQQAPPPAPPAEIGLFPPPGDPARDDWAVIR